MRELSNLLKRLSTTQEAGVSPNSSGSFLPQLLREFSLEEFAAISMIYPAIYAIQLILSLLIHATSASKGNLSIK